MKEKIGVMVVHGIGNPAPGATLYSVTDALSNAPSAVDSPTHVRFDFGTVEEKRLATQNPRKDWKAEFFPMFVRRCTVQPAAGADAATEMVFAETFWGSASQLPSGLMGMVQGIIRLFFRSQVLVTLAADQQTTGAGMAIWLRWLFFGLARVVAYLLTSPILALNVLLLLVMLVYQHGVPRFAPNDELRANALMLWVSSGCGALLAVVVLLLNSARRYTLLKHLIIPAWYLLGAIVLWALWYWVSAPSDGRDLIKPLTRTLAFAFLLVAGGLTLMIIGRGLHWLVVEWPSSKGTPHGPPLTVAIFTLIVQYGLWAAVIPTLWNLLLLNFDEKSLPHMLYAEAASTDGVQWITIVIVMACGLLALFVRWLRTRWLTRRRLDQGAAAVGTYRIIVNQLMMVPLTLVTLATVSFIVAVSLPPLLGGEQPAYAEPILHWIQANRATPIIASLIVLTISFIGDPLWLGLDLINDIINYVDQNGRKVANPISTPSVALAGIQQPNRPLVGAIRPRFRLVLNYLARTEPISHLVIIAHSQGSVIALDELADGTNQLLDQFQGKITFVTIGSPISHLYQHYFPGKYPDWQGNDSARWQHLFQRVGRWRHYYRIDDFIGMELRPIPNTLVDFAQEGISLGGHSDYWQDDRFVQKFQGLLAEVVSA